MYHSSVYHNGKRFRKALSTSRQTALKLLKDFEYDVLTGLKNTLKTPQVSLIHARLSFLKEKELSGVSDKRMQILKYVLKRLLSSMESEYICDITPVMAKQFFSNRMNQHTRIYYKSYEDDYKKKISTATLKIELQVLRQFFNHCIDMEWIDSNPFRSIKLPQETPKQRYYFTDCDIDTIMRNAGKFRDFYTVLLHTGIRPTDAYKLKKKHIQGRYLCIKMNKTKDTLNIPLSDSIISLLKVILDGIIGENDLLFPHFQSNRQKRNCCKVVQGCFRVEKVRDNIINLHTFRHTYAHNMLNKGVPKEVLQTLLGHRSIKTTEIYANWVRKEELERWVI